MALISSKGRIVIEELPMRPSLFWGLFALCVGCPIGALITDKFARWRGEYDFRSPLSVILYVVLPLVFALAAFISARCFEKRYGRMRPISPIFYFPVVGIILGNLLTFTFLIAYYPPDLKTNFVVRFFMELNWWGGAPIGLIIGIIFEVVGRLAKKRHSSKIPI